MDGDGATIEELDGAADAAAAFENLRLELLRRAVDLSANEGWKRAGCRTLATWLAAYSGIELPEARRIAKVARLAAPRQHDAPLVRPVECLHPALRIEELATRARWWRGNAHTHKRARGARRTVCQRSVG